MSPEVGKILAFDSIHWSVNTFIMGALGARYPVWRYVIRVPRQNPDARYTLGHLLGV